jgi:tetratricopeptide (TPR) repeat protein
MRWSTHEQQLAAQARARAGQLAQFMQDVFASNDAQSLGRPSTASQLLANATQRLGMDLKNQPLVRMQMLEAIGRSYLHRHLPEPALPVFEEALRLRRGTTKQPHPQTALTLAELGETLRSLNRPRDARHAYRDALDILRVTQPQPSRDFAATFGQLGSLEVEQGGFTEGLRMLSTSLQQMQEVQGLYHSDTAGLLLKIGRACQCMSDLGGAAQALYRARQIYGVSTPELNPSRLAADNAAGQLLLQQQRFDEAALILERTLAARRQLFGPSGIAVAETLNLLASVRNGQRRLEEAEELKIAALTALEGLGEAAELQRATIQLSLATLLMRTRQFARSAELLRGTIDLYDAILPADHISRTSAEHYLGETLLEQKKYREAEVILQTAIKRMQRAGVPQWRVSRSMSTLGETLYRQGKIVAAKSLLLQSHAQLATDRAAKQTAQTKARERVTTLLREPTTWASVLSQR